MKVGRRGGASAWRGWLGGGRGRMGTIMCQGGEAWRWCDGLGMVGVEGGGPGALFVMGDVVRGLTRVSLTKVMGQMVPSGVRSWIS